MTLSSRGLTQLREKLTHKQKHYISTATMLMASKLGRLEICNKEVYINRVVLQSFEKLDLLHFYYHKVYGV